jgi:hypothetical protein
MIHFCYASRERVEASRMKRMGMEVKESMGVRYEAD